MFEEKIMALTEVMKRQKAGHPIECIKNDSKLPLTCSLTAFEFSWNCPAVQQPDYGKVFIDYVPDKSIAETKSLKFYLQKYRYSNSFNEELCERIALDFAYYIRPKQVIVRLEQNSRGGIFNTTTASYFEECPKSIAALKNYKPKHGFQGGYAMEKPEKHSVKAAIGK